jgi:eukaryotic-like serine/threonine-protein kinase
MEYVDGPSAADMLRERGKQLEVDETVQIVRDACHGLEYAHRAGVVHRDVKPGNLLFAEEMGITKLADFGIAKAAEQTRITQVGSVLGTAAYLSPEQARGDEAGPASDVYSLGVCAYQFLTGRLPHEYASLTELALKQQQDPVAPVREYRPEVPPELDDAVRVALERDP